VLISRLFSEGRRLHGPGLVLTWMPLPGDALPVRVLFSAPKGRFPRAVDRNRIRRLLRESWRLHRHPLLDSLSGKPFGLALALVYRGPMPSGRSALDPGLEKMLERLAHELHSAAFEAKPDAQRGA
jgi:ribonuclease P protein component